MHSVTSDDVGDLSLGLKPELQVAVCWPSILFPKAAWARALISSLVRRASTDVVQASASSSSAHTLSRS